MSRNIVIIPTYNERENIQRMIHKVMSLGVFELLIVEDNSPDGTAALVQELIPAYPDRLHIAQRTGKLGLGTAYLHGFRWALERGYDFIFEMDADFSHNPDDLPRLLAACQDDGYDLAVGSRYVDHKVNVVNWDMKRLMMSYFASVYVHFITRMPLRDATAGFKCYRAATLRKVLERPVKFVGYAFQIEMKFRTWKYGFKIKEVPIIFTDRTAGESKMSSKIFREAFLGVISMKMHSWTQSWT